MLQTLLKLKRNSDSSFTKCDKVCVIRIYFECLVLNTCLVGLIRFETCQFKIHDIKREKLNYNIFNLIQFRAEWLTVINTQVPLTGVFTLAD